MLSISLNSEENKMRVRASYKHSAATRLFSRQNSEAGGGTASSAEKYFMNNLNRLPQNIQELHREGLKQSWEEGQPNLRPNYRRPPRSRNPRNTPAAAEIRIA